MFISFFTGKVMLFYGISLIMKEKSNASALVPYASQRTTPQMRTYHVPDADVSRPRCGRITSQTRACLDPDALTSLIFRASLIINLLILSKRNVSVVTTGKPVGNLRDKRNHHTTPR